MNVKQAVVIRKDLKMSAGLVGAQVAHISSMNFLKRLEITVVNPLPGINGQLPNIIPMTDAEKQWITTPVLVVLAVETPEELQAVYQRVIGKVICNLWEDTIYSDLLKTYLKCPVGIFIGPLDEEELKQYVGDLPLY